MRLRFSHNPSPCPEGQQFRQRLRKKFWDAPACERPGRTPVQECGIMSVSAGIRPSQTPVARDVVACRQRRPPQTQTRRFPSYSNREGGGVKADKADKADIYPRRLVEWRSSALWAREAVALSTIPFEDFLADPSSIGRVNTRNSSHPLSIRPHPDLGISSSCQLQFRPTCQRNGSCHHRPKNLGCTLRQLPFLTEPYTCCDENAVHIAAGNFRWKSNERNNCEVL